MAEPFYLSREIDEKAKERFAELYPFTPTNKRWVEIHSQSGHGNTSFLDQFGNWLSQRWNLARDTRILYVDADQDTFHGGEPANLPPLACAVLEAYLEPDKTAFQRWVRWFMRIQWGRLALHLSIILLSCVVLWVVVDMTLSPDNVKFSWKVFGETVDHVSKNWKLVLLTLVPAILIAILIEYVKKLREEGTEENERRDRRSRIEERIKRYGGGMINALEDICRRHAHLVILVDNGHKLRADERKFLEQALGHPAKGSPSGRQFESFARRFHPAVIEHRNKDTEQTGGLHIPAFTREDIERICLSYPQLCSLSEETRNFLIDGAAASQNIHAIFLEEKYEQKEKVRQEWEDRTELVEELDERDLSALFATQYGEITTTDGLTNLPTALHLQAFFKKTEDTRATAIAFRDKQTCLFTKENSSVRQNAASCRYLQSILMESGKGRGSLERAHFWWYLKLFAPWRKREPGSIVIAQLSAEDSGRVRRAAWHLLELDRIGLDKEATDATQDTEAQQAAHAPQPSAIDRFLSTTRFQGDALHEVRLRAAGSLLLALEINIAEGNVSAACEDARHALAWLAGVKLEDALAPHPDTVLWLGFAARTLWMAYWLTFDPEIHSLLANLLEHHPFLKQNANWSVFQQYEDLLKGSFIGTEACSEPDRTKDPDLYNFWALTRVLRWIRERHGFTRKGLSQPELRLFADEKEAGDPDTLVFPAPCNARDVDWAEFMLLEMRATGFILRINSVVKLSERERGETDADTAHSGSPEERIRALPSLADAERFFAPLRAKIGAASVDAESLTGRLKWEYFSARLSHLLLNFYTERTALTETLFGDWKQDQSEVFSQSRGAIATEAAVGQFALIEEDRRGFKLWLTSYGFEEARLGYNSIEHTKDRVKARYEEAIALATPLGIKAYQMNTTFWLAEFIWDYRQAPKNGNVPVGNAARQNVSQWDELLKECIRIEEEAGWMLYTPPIHRIHWRYAENIDRSATIFDGMNLLESFRAAGYPRRIYLNLHRDVRRLFVNHSHDTGDKKVIMVGSGLLEEWAMSECLKPMSWRYWEYESLIHTGLVNLWIIGHPELPEDDIAALKTHSAQLVESEVEGVWLKLIEQYREGQSVAGFRYLLLLERCLALQFAAQSSRVGEDLVRAKELLHLAQECIHDPAIGTYLQPSSTTSNVPPELRRLIFNVQLQLAWTDERLHPDVPLAVKKGRYLDIWRRMVPSDDLATCVLESIVALEDKEGILSDSWTTYTEASDVGPAYATDIDNPTFVVDMPKVAPIKPINRFHFRLLQVLQLGCGSFVPSPGFLRSRIGHAQSLERQMPGRDTDEKVWNGQNSYGRAVIRLGELEAGNNYLGRRRDEIIQPLRAVCEVFAELKQLAPAIDGYKLLMSVEPDEGKRRQVTTRYADLSSQHDNALTNVIRIRMQRAGLVEAAKQATDHLAVVVNGLLAADLKAKKIAASGQESSYDSQLAELLKALPQAIALKEMEDPRGAMDSIAAFLQDPFCSSRSWIRLEHLQALDLWLRCAEQLEASCGLSDEERASYPKRRMQLHEMTIDYITELGDTLSDRRMKALAAKWAQMIHGEYR